MRTGQRLIVLCGLIAPLASGQTPAKPSQQLAPTASDCRMAEPSGPPRIQPFTAEWKVTSVQILANGVTITRDTREMAARDSQGRTLRANSIITFPRQDRELISFTADDPVNGTQVLWTTQNKQATMLRLPPVKERHGCWRAEHQTIDYGPAPTAIISNKRTERNRSTGSGSAGAAHGPGVQSHAPITGDALENLGTLTIEGVLAEGHRTTRITPTGEIGNDRPLVRIDEFWIAMSLGIELRRLTDDPREGRTVKQLTKLEMSEPSLATFQPPEGYEVKVEDFRPCSESQP